MTHEASDVDAMMALTLARALAAETAAAAGAETMLVSITADLIARPGAGEPQTAAVKIVRATRSLVFAEAELTGAEGRRLMTASGVYKIPGA
ncbi:MAG: hypothetical protein KJS97_07385 [Alphaproteobacteria bacterium]|nr:hypothetical protein [Alphaproteobacteria bacterium]